MAILSTVGRSSPGMRVLIGVLYVVLAAGAVTMIYPFLLMLSTSITSKVDVNEYKVVPRYLYDDDVLFAKHVEEKYALDPNALNAGYGTEIFDFAELVTEAKGKAPILKKRLDEIRQTAPTAVHLRLKDYREFLATLPLGYKSVAFLSTPGMSGPVEKQYQEFVKQKFNGDLNACRREYQEEAMRFGAITPTRERLLARDYVPDGSAKYRDFLEFKRALPETSLLVVSVEPKFVEFLNRRYDSDAKKLNAVMGTTFEKVSEARLPEAPPPEDSPWREVWSEYVRMRMPLSFIGIVDGKTRFEAFVQNQKHQLPAVEMWDANVRPGVDRPRLDVFGDASALLYDFMRAESPDKLRVLSSENLYRDFLAEKYGSVEQLNQVYATKNAAFSAFNLPAMEADYEDFSGRTSETRRHFMGPNYTEAINYMVLYGNAAWNTVVFVLLTVITSLTVNPLAAYALSRFQLSYTNKILLFCLATMAFPPEVGMIPSFLMLRSLPLAQLVVGLVMGLLVFLVYAIILRGKAPMWIGVVLGLLIGTTSALATPIADAGRVSLLNSYWALILPGVANGFSIFMFKGFFDSQPRELYEAASMEGAGELRMFFTITLPLCAPVMAVIGLDTFKSAYGAFMFALLVCQKEETWTLMVYLYQMQQWAPTSVLIAALTLAAIPTLIAILVAQRFILRGIVLPSMH